MEQVKLLSLTIVLTAVIWITADSLVNQTISVPVSFEVGPAAGVEDLVVSLPPDAPAVDMQVSGPRKSLAQLQTEGPLRIRLLVPPQPAGVSYLPLRETLREQWRKPPRVAVVSTQPERLPVLIDRFVTSEVILTIQNPTLAYDVKPQLRRGSVAVRMLQSKFDEMASQGRLPPMDLSAEVERLLRDQPAGQNVTVSVPLDARVFGPGARLTPGSVDVQAVVTAQRLTAQVPTVPILITTSFSNFGKFYRAVTRDGSELITRTITVKGPRDAVERLVRGESRAFGFVQLKDEHFANMGIYWPLTPEYHLPDSIELAKPPEPVELKLVEADRNP